ncbi:sulfatase [Luteitalea sp.]
MTTPVRYATRVRTALWPVLFLGLGLCAMASLVAQPAPASAPPRMNVLLIMADDLNTDLATYGGPARSPSIDGLARRGLRFDRAYTQYPVCNQSRSSMLTGRRPDATGVLSNPGRNPMSPHFRERLPDAVTLPQLFRTNGYVTARVGKLFHYGVPLDIGTGGLDDHKSWDIAINPRGRDRELLDRVFTLVPGQFGGTVSWLADDEGDDAQHTDGIGAAEAVRLLERFGREQRPFFLGVGFYRPHTPYVAPRRYFDEYPTAGIPLPALSADDRARVPKAAYRRATAEQDAMTDAQRRDAIQAYQASITFMDAQVGLVLDALDRLGLTDSTIVVFTSDHGYHLGDHGLWQKPSLFERNARVPLVIAAPGKARGATTRALAELVDLYPTLADLAGLTAPGPLDGQSLAPVIASPTREVRDAAFTQAYNGYAVRTDRWRYMEWAAGAEGRQLYDLAADPAETRNLADEPAHAAVVADLSARLAAYRKK